MEKRLLILGASRDAPTFGKQKPPIVATQVSPIPAPGPPKTAKFQPTPIGIIYEEISLIDSMDDEWYHVFTTIFSDPQPTLFDATSPSISPSSALSASTLRLQPKPSHKTRAESIASHYPRNRTSQKCARHRANSCLVQFSGQH